ncbi:MAG TPA: Ada metal-binding domain-containing protein [Planctomycetota bacterium]|nr:Ada metal-binding domain-containing protein [Planctomycetota bacterium]
MTNYLNNKSRRAPGSKRSGGGTVVQVLTFVGAAVIILGAIIAYEKRARSRTHAGDEPASSASVGTLNSDEYYRSRGLLPNNPTDPPVDNVIREPTPTTPQTQPTPTTPQYRYVGRSDWNRYHRPNCKYALNVPEDKKISFASAADARAKGYIPCKICRPPVPSADDPTPATTPSTTPVHRPVKPVSLPIEDVNVPFPFQVKDSEAIIEKGVIRVEVTVEVEKPLNRDNILLLSRKLVAAETRKQPVNAVSIIMQKKTTARDPIKWICWVDWAPYGNLVRASEVKPGDYRTHQFDIFQHGTIQLRR